MSASIKPISTPVKRDIDNPNDIAQFVRARRTQEGIRIDDAAKLCGVSVETLSKIETAKAGVNVDSLFKVLNGLGIKIVVKPW
ncbi:hypothetical protein AZI86_12480 [Bdellovibrio bacteriovorus]|uniref:HTH cro/C1-type domain-containing protein n=1 Tax=Bdellovibrio bacteriovorus TaxID=959 RepID=A0A150WJE2_BDEBC|nr:helix-turn-helix transcriptional regulator [Bdellovibrio bacteriovorus]KYG63641.1 hypothetical protein AZI86_12480 [Bdellovibrio bacteriovorus]